MTRITRIGNILNGTGVEREGPYDAHWREVAVHMQARSVNPPLLRPRAQEWHHVSGVAKGILGLAHAAQCLGLEAVPTSPERDLKSIKTNSNDA